MKISRILMVFIVLGFGGSAIARESIQVYKDEIKTIVKTFRLSIIKKDKETFKSLFYSESIPWIVVFSDEMVNAKKKGKT